METTLQKHIGHTVDIIYLGRDNRITKRHIEIRSVTGGIVKAFP